MIHTCMEMRLATRPAVLREKLWKVGDTITISFMGGSESLKHRIRCCALEWLNYANLSFMFSAAKGEVRISFKKGGCWSYVGTDALLITKNSPTMNFGWLTDDTPDEEVRRVVQHEFGHMLGMIHEHQNPKAGINWNKNAVYSYYEKLDGWSRQQIDRNLFDKYSEDQVNAGEFDAQSIMLYPIPNEFTTDDFSVGWNTNISHSDKVFMSGTYPR